jgi:hypothetical protein
MALPGLQSPQPRPLLEHKGQTLLSSPPRFTERKPARAPEKDNPAAPAERTAPLIERLPGMSDHMLRAYQTSARRVSENPGHPKHAAARRAVPQIEAEIRRRADALATPSGDPARAGDGLAAPERRKGEDRRRKRAPE